MIMLILLLIFFLSTSCIRTEFIGEPMTKSIVEKQKDTTIVLPPQQDTTQVPIIFNPDVEDWEDCESEI